MHYAITCVVELCGCVTECAKGVRQVDRASCGGRWRKRAGVCRLDVTGGSSRGVVEAGRAENMEGEVFWRNV